MMRSALNGFPEPDIGVVVSEHVVQCPVCAWRGECNKKFHFESQGGRLRCPDFTKDLAIRNDKERPDAEKS